MGNHNLKSIIKEGTVENVKEFLAEEPEMKNHVFRYGWTPTHLAVEYHKLDILRYLIEEAEADTKHVDNALSNLLHHALHHAETHFDIVTYLLENKHFKFDAAKDEHQNTTLHLAFRYCTLKEIVELNKYYKGLKGIFMEKNDHGDTPLALLRERCKNSPESLVIVQQLQEDIEKGDSPNASQKNSDDEKEGSKKLHGSSKHNPNNSGEIKEASKHGSRHGSKHSKNDHEEKEESKKHSDDEKHGSKKSKHSGEEGSKSPGEGKHRHNAKHGSKHEHEEKHSKHKKSDEEN